MKRTLLAVAKVIGYLVAVVIATVVVMGLTKTLIGDWEAGGARLRLFGDGFLTSLGIAITSILAFRLLRAKEVFLGWPGWKTGLVWFGKGGILGSGMAGVMVLLTILFGGARIAFEGAPFSAYVRYVGPLAGALLIAALGEEWLFRGYPMTKLAEVMGSGWANLLIGLLFAAAHLGSAGANPLILVNIVIGSAVVGSMRFTPGGIPAAWGFHFVWNCTQVLLGANLSLEGIDAPGVVFSPSGEAVVSGGSFGPEAGIGATISTVLVLALLIVYFRRRGVHDLPLPFGRRSETRFKTPSGT